MCLLLRPVQSTVGPTKTSPLAPAKASTGGAAAVHANPVSAVSMPIVLKGHSSSGEQEESSAASAPSATHLLLTSKHVTIRLTRRHYQSAPESSSNVLAPTSALYHPVIPQVGSTFSAAPSTESSGAVSWRC